MLSQYSRLAKNEGLEAARGKHQRHTTPTTTTTTAAATTTTTHKNSESCPYVLSFSISSVIVVCSVNGLFCLCMCATEWERKQMKHNWATFSKERKQTATVFFSTSIFLLLSFLSTCHFLTLRFHVSDWRFSNSQHQRHHGHKFQNPEMSMEMSNDLQHFYVRLCMVLSFTKTS